MIRFLLVLIVLAAAGFFFVKARSASPFEIEREGRTVKVRGGHMATRYVAAGSLSGEFMVFGAHDKPSSVESAWLLTTSVADGRWLLGEYPDLRRCGSAGAEHFKRIAEGMYLIGANGRAHSVLASAAAAQVERERSGGGRQCLRLRGELVSLEYAGMPEANRDLTPELQRMRSDTPTYLVDEATPIDCEPGPAG